MGGVIVVVAGRSLSTFLERDAYIHVIALNIVITMRFSINYPTVICFPLYDMCSREKPLVKAMALGSTFIIYKNEDTMLQFISFVFHFTLSRGKPRPPMGP